MPQQLRQSFQSIMPVTRLRIIQHNVLQWSKRKIELYNIYRDFDPDLILLNSHGIKDDSNIKVFGYTV